MQAQNLTSRSLADSAFTQRRPSASPRRPSAVRCQADPLLLRVARGEGAPASRGPLVPPRLLWA